RPRRLPLLLEWQPVFCALAYRCLGSDVALEEPGHAIARAGAISLPQKLKQTLAREIVNTLQPFQESGIVVKRPPFPANVGIGVECALNAFLNQLSLEVTNLLCQVTDLLRRHTPNVAGHLRAEQLDVFLSQTLSHHAASCLRTAAPASAMFLKYRPSM